MREREIRTLARKTLSFWTLLELEGEACYETSSLGRTLKRRGVQ
jgi:hypothetical protein